MCNYLNTAPVVLLGSDLFKFLFQYIVLYCKSLHLYPNLTTLLVELSQYLPFSNQDVIDVCANLSSEFTEIEFLEDLTEDLPTPRCPRPKKPTPGTRKSSRTKRKPQWYTASTFGSSTSKP